MGTSDIGGKGKVGGGRGHKEERNKLTLVSLSLFYDIGTLWTHFIIRFPDELFLVNGRCRY